MRFRYLVIMALLVFSSCKKDGQKTVDTPSETKPTIKLQVPSFDRDSAYSFIAKQVNFGPRRPNTDAHIACKNWMVSKFESYGLTTKVQEFKATTYFDEKMTGYNVIGQYKPDLEKRIMISAHWDTRFMADKDAEEGMRDKPIAGADDGGSGVAAIIELARLLQNQDIPVGVDFVLFDLEDQGENGSGDELSWCLGSQHWAKNPHISKFKFGINLDMVASKGAKFKKEGYSMRYAPAIVSKVWTWGKRLGYGQYFLDAKTGGVTDDHVFVNRSGVGPMINIIYTTREFGGSFGKHWHTHNDDIENIDRNVLKAVGQVVTNVIYKEAEGTF